MQNGKPAGVRCVQLDDRDRCRLFGDPRRPHVCGSLQPAADMCGDTREHAMRWLTELERLTFTTADRHLPQRNTPAV